MHIEKIDLDSEREIVRFFFLKVIGNINLKRKYEISSYFFIIKMLELNSQSKHTLYITNFTFLRLIHISVFYSIDLLRG